MTRLEVMGFGVLEGLVVESLGAGLLEVRSLEEEEVVVVVVVVVGTFLGDVEVLEVVVEGARGVGTVDIGLLETSVAMTLVVDCCRKRFSASAAA